MPGAGAALEGNGGGNTMVEIEEYACMYDMETIILKTL